VQLHPTRTAVDLAIVAIFVMAVGVLSQTAPIVAWGGALVLGLTIARAVTLLSVARVRSAGFEMLWREQRKLARAGLGEEVTLQAEVRNRDDRATRYVQLRSLQSQYLHVDLEPTAGEVPAGGRLAVKVTVKGTRVGRHGVFGLSLEVRGGPGLYEVPLTFSNPFGLEVLPTTYATRTRPALGGRSRARGDHGQPGNRPQGNYDLREIRDYQAGDPFKRIAWKAAARRGRLMVREFDLEERDIVWFLLDASVELWAGPAGRAPLDVTVERVASLAEHHIERGHRVGLAVVAGRRLSWLPPGTGSAHVAQMLANLAFSSSCHDVDRSAWDESDVALRVLEHLRPLEPGLVLNVRSHHLDRIANAAAEAIRRAPFEVPTPLGAHGREGVLRRYLAAFGIPSPPRLEPDRPRTDTAMVAALREMLSHRPKPSLIVVCSPAPDPHQQQSLLQGISKLPRRHVKMRWLPTPLYPSSEDTGSPNNVSDGLEIAPSVDFALALHAHVTETAGVRALGQLGVRLQTPPRPFGRRHPASSEHEAAIPQPNELGHQDPPGSEKGSAA